MPVAPAALLSDATAEEGGTFDRGAEIYVRPHPFPFIAAFALSNDCDSCGMEAFEDWHAFVNGRASTPYGEGLGLEIGDSFWVWLSGSGGLALSMGSADEPVREPAYVERLAEIGRAGWFDTLHSLGNWRQDYKSFRHDLGTREQVERSLEMLDARGFKPFVYVNHSFSPSNVSGPWGFYQKMDDPAHPMYAMDLIRKFGFRYFWPDYAQDVEKFGDQLAYKSDAELRQSIKDYRQWKLIYKRTSLTEAHVIDFPLELAELRALRLAMFNRTIVRVPALDGLPMAAFKRYRGPSTADESSFHLQASLENLDSLEQRGGAVIVYQHFGVTRDGPDNAKRRSTPPVLSANSVGAWRGCGTAVRDHDGAPAGLPLSGGTADIHGQEIARTMDDQVGAARKIFRVVFASQRTAAQWAGVRRPGRRAGDRRAGFRPQEAEIPAQPGPCAARPPCGLSAMAEARMGAAVTSRSATRTCADGPRTPALRSAALRDTFLS